MPASRIQRRGPVRFPEFTGERVYMRQFTKRDGLAADLRRWQPTVDAMLANVETDAPIFIMVDQTELKAGTPQRRPGVHVDGIWRAGSGWDNNGGHGHVGDEVQSLILASDVAGCRGYEGEFFTAPGEGGDCQHVDLTRFQSFVLDPFTAWAGNSLTTLHESIPVARDCRRTLVRLNVCDWLPDAARA